MTDLTRISLVCGPVDEFTFLVHYTHLPDALEAIAQEMRAKGVMILSFEDDDIAESGIDEGAPVLETKHEFQSFIARHIDNDSGDGPEDGTYTVTCADDSTYTVTAADINNPVGSNARLWFVWDLALKRHKAGGPRPSTVTW
jgi:hypothetical protein